MTERRDPRERPSPEQSGARTGGDPPDPAGVGEFKAVAGRLLETGSRYLGDAWAGGRHWLNSRRNEMGRERDWERHRERHRERDWERDDPPHRQRRHVRDRDGHGEVRGRYLPEGGAGRADPVHWQPDAHLPGSDPRADGEPAGSYRGYGPRGYVRSDARILEDLCERLSDDPVVDARGIEVRCEAGRVILEGEVPGRWMKHRSEDIADSVSGVQDIENRLRVVRPDGPGAAAGERGSPPQQSY